MPYSNDITQIRSGLVNYIGATITTLPHSVRANKQVVASVLIEEALALAKDGEMHHDLYVLKPLLRGLVYVLQMRCQEMKELPAAQAAPMIEEYQRTIRTLENLIDAHSK